MKIRMFFALCVCRFTRFALRITGRGGTAIPGRLALKLCPDVLRLLAKEVQCVCVTGTNGKTTTSRMIEQCFAEAKLPYFSNKSGANLLGGIVADFVDNATLFGKAKTHYAVIECDEAASVRVFRDIQPTCIVVTNVFRDQLDRYGEIANTLNNILTGVKGAPKATLCLNADCSLTASIARSVENPVIWYGVKTEIYKNRVKEVSDAPNCFFCQHEYEYDYVTYGHLGGFRCPQCGYARPESSVTVTAVCETTPDSCTVEMDIAGQKREVFIRLPGGYNIYNAAAAAACAKAMDMTPETSVDALKNFECGFGRMEKFDLNGIDVRMILIKNPAGCNQVLNYITEAKEPTLFAVCLNDLTGDGKDISWIWDADFERLVAMGDCLTGILCAGRRADDMALRFKYAGLPAEKLRVVHSDQELISAITAQNAPVVIMPTYSAMLELRGTLAEQLGYKKYWE